MSDNTTQKPATFEINDAHCHFFSEQFFTKLSSEFLPERKHRSEDDTTQAVLDKLEWDAPGSVDTLADRWVAELDRVNVTLSLIHI